LTEVLSPDLCTAIILCIFHSEGIAPLEVLVMKRWYKGEARV